MLEHREVRLRESAGGRRGSHPGELGVVVLLLLLELLLLLVVVHARVVLEGGAAGPDHGGPVEGAAAASAAAVGADVDPGDGRERRELGLRLAPVERRRAPAAAGGGRGGEGGVVPVGGRDVAARRVVLRGRPMRLRTLDVEFYTTSAVFLA